MANRNKKGKIHSLFTSEFDVTFFYKPSTDEGVDYRDRYYYIVLSDTILIKARFIENAIFIIDSTKSLTTSLTSRYYDMLAEFLKECESITVMVSVIGCCQEFVQSCRAIAAPVVESPEFTEYPDRFYNRFKTYNHDDISLCGYFLLSLEEKSFKAAKDRINNGNCEFSATENFLSSMKPQQLLDVTPIPILKGFHDLGNGTSINNGFLGGLNTNNTPPLEVYKSNDSENDEFNHTAVELHPIIGVLRGLYTDVEICTLEKNIPNVVQHSVIVTASNHVGPNDRGYLSMRLDHIFGKNINQVKIHEIVLDTILNISFHDFILQLHELVKTDQNTEYIMCNITLFNPAARLLDGNPNVECIRRGMFDGNDYKIK